MGDRQLDSGWVEGYDQDGKSLERMVKAEELEKLQMQVKEQEVALSKELREKKNKVEESQEELQNVNQQHLVLKEESEDLARTEKVELDSEQKSRIERVTKDTIDGFLARQDTGDKTLIEVDVHFVAEKDTTSETLHLGGEGAGSRDARFIVSLDSTVEQLASQAAKYWGLDAHKVFFLDKDDRIVPDDMQMFEIVLPPAKKGHKSDDAALDIWTVKGRNYSFNLVRAETVLKKEDLSSSNGVKWADFTFQEAKLEEELENTRKKYGDSGQVEATVNMDEIPSLYDLINKGRERKARKRKDMQCRMVEFATFSMVAAFFYWLLRPDDPFNFYMEMINRNVQADFVTFPPAGTSGIADFNKISTLADYQDWMRGPFTDVVFGPYTPLRGRDIYVLSAFGVTYTGTPTNHSVDFCVAGAPKGSEKCYASSLKSCMTSRAVVVYDDGMADGHDVGTCQDRFEESALQGFFDSYDPPNHWTFILGWASTYVGGQKTYFNLTERASFDASVNAFLGLQQVQKGPAQLVNVIMYVPALQGISIIQLLLEDPKSGAYLTHVKMNAVNAVGSDPRMYPVWLWVIALGFATFLMQIRRIIGRPARWTFEDKREPCSCSTFVFFILPFLIFAIFVLATVREEEAVIDNLVSIERVTADGFEVTQETLSKIYEVTVLDAYILRLKLCILIIINMMFFRYLLAFFPQLHQLKRMVGKMLKPILVTLLMVMAAVMGLSMVLYITYGGKFSQFRNIYVTSLRLISIVMGGFSRWFDLYLMAPGVFMTVQLAALVIVTLLLSNMTLAIMVSHKREKDLHENASFHPFWTAGKSKAANDPRGFNPSMMGEDFRKKKPKEDD